MKDMKKITAEQLLEKVFEAKEYNEDDGFWFISIVNLRAIINALTTHTEPEDEPKLITDEMEADILGMFYKEASDE